MRCRHMPHWLAEEVENENVHIVESDFNVLCDIYYLMVRISTEQSLPVPDVVFCHLMSK